MITITFYTTKEFEKEYKRLSRKYPSLKDDLKKFKVDFIDNPNLGDDLGNNIRKVRIAIKSKGKGKSGGARVIVYNLMINIMEQAAILITIYDKSDAESISKEHIKEIISRNGFG